MAAFILTDMQKVPMALSAASAEGNPAGLDGVPSWSSSDEAILMLTVAEDGLSAVAEAVGPMGTAQVSVTADARIGEEVVALTGLQDFEVVASEAVTLGIAVGTPESK